jgi:hypothetical protein
MAIQQDPSKSFGSTSYFQNKDEQRRVVNSMRREERNKRIAQQGLTRNIKRAIRKGENPNAYIDAAKQMGLDPLGGGGFGPEAGQRDAALRAKAAAGFEEVSQQRQKSDKAVGNKKENIKKESSTSTVRSVGSSSAVGSVGSSSAASSDTTEASNIEGVDAGVDSNVSNKPKEPEWFTGDVKKDTTFRGVDLTNPRFIGKTREEARQMIMSQKAANDMRYFDSRGKANAKVRDDAYNQMISGVTAKADIDKKTQAALDPTNIAKQKADFAASQARSEEYKKALERFDSITPALDKSVESVGLFQDYTDASMAGIKAQSDFMQRVNTSNIMRDAQTQRNAQDYMDQEATIADQLARKEKLQNEIQLKNDLQQAKQSALKNQFNTSAKGVIYNTLGNIVENTARGIRANVATLTTLSKQQQRDFSAFKKDIQNAFNPY